MSKRARRSDHDFDVTEFLRPTDVDMRSALDSLLRGPAPELPTAEIDATQRDIPPEANLPPGGLLYPGGSLPPEGLGLPGDRSPSSAVNESTLQSFPPQGLRPPGGQIIRERLMISPPEGLLPLRPVGHIPPAPVGHLPTAPRVLPGGQLPPPRDIHVLKTQQQQSSTTIVAAVKRTLHKYLDLIDDAVADEIVKDCLN